MTVRYLASLVLLVAVGFFVGRAFAQAPPSGAAARPAPPPTNCKVYGPGKCCDPAAAAHLTKEAIYAACGESDATFLGEQGQKDTCKYFFKVEGQPEADTFVQVYAPQQKEVLPSPNDPFFSWKKVGKAYMTDKAKSPKAAPMAANSTGLYLPGKGYSVSVNASTKVCTKQEAAKLAPSMK